MPVGEHLRTGGGDGIVVVNPATCGHRSNKEGKDPMRMDVYMKLWGWLLDWNTNDGVFGHCFLLLTWNLSCHTENTANIRLCEINIEWGSTFDMFEIYFAHMKMDQTGDKAKYFHHLYANPCCPLICPVLSLAFYFSRCFRMPTCTIYHREISFIPAWDDWGKTYSAQQFPMFNDVPQFLHLKLKCLASMVNHCRFIVEWFNANHVVLASGQLF